jgi:hypothetical protein
MSLPRGVVNVVATVSPPEGFYEVDGLATVHAFSAACEVSVLSSMGVTVSTTPAAEESLGSPVRTVPMTTTGIVFVGPVSHINEICTDNASTASLKDAALTATQVTTRTVQANPLANRFTRRSPRLQRRR